MRARAVVNAAGVWADDVRALDEGAHPASIRPAKGIHITVPWSKVRNDIAAIVPVRDDRRSMFVVPWGDTTYIGTTDTDYDGPLDDPPCTAADVDYLLGAINGVTDDKLTEADVVGTWAGLAAAPAPGSQLAHRRPVAPAFRPHRAERRGHRHRREAHHLPAHGRRRGRRRPRRARRAGGDASRTKHLRLFGGEGMAPPVAALEPSAHEHLTGRYGTDAEVVLALVADEAELGAAARARPARTSRPKPAYAVAHEMARTLDDVLSRRTRARLLARDASAAAAGEVAALLAPELGWSDAERDAQVAAYRASIADERGDGP